MAEASVTHITSESLWLVLFMSLPPLAVAATVGLVVGLLQAVTQIQDQTLPMAVKVIVVVLVLVVLGPMLAEPLVQHSRMIFDEFAVLTRGNGRL